MLILDFDRICRLCLTNGEKLVSIFEYGSGLSHRIESCTCLKLASSDGLPNALCMECLSKLDQIKDFQDQCERSETVLKEYLQANGPDFGSKVEESNNKVGVQNQGNKEVTGKPRRGRREENQRLTTSTKQVPDNSSNDDSDWGCSEEVEDNLDNGTQQHISVKQESVSNDELEDQNDQLTPSDAGFDCRSKKNKRFYSDSNTCKIKKAALPLKNFFSDNGQNHNNGIEVSDDSEYEWPGSLSDEDQSNSSGIPGNMEENDCRITGNSRKRKEKSYECEFCGRSFPRSNHLAQHELTHTKEKPFTCSYCQKGFWYKNSLIGHIKQTHTGDVNYTCEDCGRGFFQRSEYMRHKPIHSNETPFKCEQCDMSFKLMKNLRRHQKVHSGARTHTCQYCGKSFRMLQTLRVHLVLHSGEKPYKCSHCGRGFSQSAPLKAHIRMHTGERPYVCNTCGEAFPTGNSLKSHTFKHTGVYPNSCRPCSTLFKRKRDLVDHWNVVHGGHVTELLQVPPQLPSQDVNNCKSDSTSNTFQQHPLQIKDEQQLPLPRSQLPPSTPVQQCPHFDDQHHPLLGGSIGSLSDENDSLSCNPLTHHPMLQDQLPPVLEISDSVVSQLLSPTIMKSPSMSGDLIADSNLSFS